MNDPVQDILGRLEVAKQTGSAQWQARCPAHDDRHASLSVSRGKDDRVLLHCHAGCSAMAICRALGLPMRALSPPNHSRTSPGRIVAAYDYRDAAGELLYQVVRLDPKDFRQRRPDGSGGWTWDMNGVPRILYRLPELLAADPTHWVFVVEGEKDADSLAGLGLIATTNPMGAGNWSKLSDDSALHARRVAILPDKDDAGRRHAAAVAGALCDRAKALRIVELPGEGKDVFACVVARAHDLAILFQQLPVPAQFGPVPVVDQELVQVPLKAEASFRRSPCLFAFSPFFVRRRFLPGNGLRAEGHVRRHTPPEHVQRPQISPQFLRHLQEDLVHRFIFLAE